MFLPLIPQYKNSFSISLPQYSTPCKPTVSNSVFLYDTDASKHFNLGECNEIVTDSNEAPLTSDSVNHSKCGNDVSSRSINIGSNEIVKGPRYSDNKTDGNINISRIPTEK